MAIQKENQNVQLEQIENVSPQVPSLETEYDKQEVVEPEVLKPSDNKNYSNAEAHKPNNDSVQDEEFEEVTDLKSNTNEKKSFVTQEFIDEQKASIANKKAEVDRRRFLEESYQNALTALEKDIIPIKFETVISYAEEVKEEAKEEQPIKPDVHILVESFTDYDGEEDFYYPVWKVTVNDREKIFPIDVEPRGIDRAYIGSDIIDEITNFIFSEETQKNVAANGKIYKQLKEVSEALKLDSQSSFNGFEGILIYRTFRFIGIHAYHVSRYQNYKGEWKDKQEVIGSPCAVIERFRFNNDENVQYKLRFLNTNGIYKNVILTQHEFDTPSGIHSKLGQAGCMIRDTTKFMKMLHGSFDMGVAHGNLPILNAVDIMGWVGDSYLNGDICCGVTKYFCTDKNIVEEFYKEGTEEKYSEGIKGLANIEEVRVAMAAQVAAILLKIVGCPSFTMIVYGETSKIKTTRWKLASSMVGNSNKIIMTFDQSGQVLNQKLKKRRDTFLIIDEAKTEEDKRKAQEAIKHVSSGTTRQVYRFNEDKIDSSEVSCILMITSEHSPFDAATFGGTLVRCLEFKTNMNQDLSKEIEAFEDLVAPKIPDFNPKNFGWLTKPIYEVINKHKKELRGRFKDIKNKFDRTSAKSNRISDMQAVLVLGLELLDEVFANKKDVYPWYVPFDNFEIVDDLTADHVENASKPEVLRHLELVLSHFSVYSMYMNPPEPQGQNGIVHTQQIKGFIKEDKKFGKLYMLNAADVQALLTPKKINYETFIKSLYDKGLTKVYTRKDKKGNIKPNGYTIQDMSADSLVGSQYVALIVNELHKFLPIPHEEAIDSVQEKADAAAITLKKEEERIAKEKELLASIELERERLDVMKAFFYEFNKDGIALGVIPFNDNVIRFCMEAPAFPSWLVSVRKAELFEGVI